MNPEKDEGAYSERTSPTTILVVDDEEEMLNLCRDVILEAGGRENLPAAAAQRLETVVDLAIRLRETVRRLSQMWESHHAAARSA
jgi:hypothetical protein